jgi:hypothetical protein
MKKKRLEFATYRKPTETDVIILNDSCLPQEHKIFSIKYLVNRLNTYQLSREEKVKDTLHNII